MRCHTAARSRVSEEFCASTEPFDLTGFELPLASGHHVDVAPVRALLGEAIARFEKPTESDRWLGPRLHSALRLSAREASDPEVWMWLGLGPGIDYVRWRFENRKPNRFVGSRDVQAFSRLWWIAEMFRDGPDYTPAVQALIKQDVPNTLLRLDVAHHRPTLLAFLRLRRKAGKAGELSGREVNAAAQAINIASVTYALEQIGPHQRNTGDRQAYDDWRTQAVSLSTLLSEELPDGPAESKVPAASVDALAALFQELLEEAHVRDERTTPDVTADAQA
jgi:hypothetical protein